MNLSDIKRSLIEIEDAILMPRSSLRQKQLYQLRCRSCDARQYVRMSHSTAIDLGSYLVEMPDPIEELGYMERIIDRALDCSCPRGAVEMNEQEANPELFAEPGMGEFQLLAFSGLLWTVGATIGDALLLYASIVPALIMLTVAFRRRDLSVGPCLECYNRSWERMESRFGVKTVKCKRCGICYIGGDPSDKIMEV